MTPAIFIPIPGGRRVRCATCDRTGYPGGLWQDQCRAGHPHACDCGRRFINRSALSAHTHPRRPGGEPRHKRTP